MSTWAALDRTLEDASSGAGAPCAWHGTGPADVLGYNAVLGYNHVIKHMERKRSAATLVSRGRGHTVGGLGYHGFRVGARVTDDAGHVQRTGVSLRTPDLFMTCASFTPKKNRPVARPWRALMARSYQCIRPH